MRRDTLEYLLAEADAKLPPPPTGPLVERVRARAVHRARVRVALAAAACLAIAATIIYSTRSRPIVVRETGPKHWAPDSGQWRAQLAALDATAAMHQKTAEDLMAAEQKNDALQKLEMKVILAAEPLTYLDRARDRAARIILMDGDRNAEQSGGNTRAKEAYRRAAQLFPETSAAREALKRLKSTGI